MLRAGLHFSNACPITLADIDIVKRWSPLSLLEAMDNTVNDSLKDLVTCWELAGHCEIVLRRYYTPVRGGPARWGAHAHESVDMARKLIAAGVPVEMLMLKPFNEPNMPEWACWEGFGDQPEDMERYNRALLQFIDIAHNELPGIRVGGPHLTIGNRDVKFPNDPPGYYYYHGPDMFPQSSPCYEALRALDVHFVHCYALYPGQYRQRAYGLRFLEYERYLPDKPIYNVEAGCAINSDRLFHENITRGEDTAQYLHLLGDTYPQVKGVAFFIGGHVSWDAFRHSDSPEPDRHRPVVFKVEEAGHAAPDPPVDPPPNPDKYKLVRGLFNAGIQNVVDLRPEIESFSDMAELTGTWVPHDARDTVTWHHSASDKYHDPIRIARYHVLEKKGAKDATIPYHFCILPDGTLCFTAKLIYYTKHTHSYVHNRRSLGICVLGDFTKGDPTAAQLDTARRLIYALNEFYGGGWGKFRGFYMTTHRRVSSTACPGNLEHLLIKAGDWPVTPFFQRGAAGE
jgi:hypothetical protein